VVQKKKRKKVGDSGKEGHKKLSQPNEAAIAGFSTGVWSSRKKEGKTCKRGKTTMKRFKLADYKKQTHAAARHTTVMGPGR